MDWWNDLTDWISSDDGWRVISGAIIPFVAIVVAGVVAALIGRGATKRVVAMQEREARNSAVAAIISAARKAATWGSLGHDERGYADHLAEDADIRLRLLPVAGAPLAASWAQHEIADIKKNSSTFSFQAEQSLAEFRDRMLDWQARPSRARKLFKSDLERWKFDSPDPDAELITRQQEWNADQNGAARATDATPTPTAAPAERPTPTTTSLRPAPQRTSGAQAPSTTGGASAGRTAAAAATTAGAGFSVTRNGSAATDPNATTPISDTTSTNATTPVSDTTSTNATTPVSDAPRADGDGATRSYGDGATRSYGDGATRAYGDGATRAYGTGAAAPSRPQLGSPLSPSRAPGASPAGVPKESDTDDADAVDDPGANSSTSPDRTASGATVVPSVAQPTSADAHVNRTTTGDADAPAPTHTTSIPARVANDHAEPADANETSEAPYTQPISASELRRRAADDDE